MAKKILAIDIGTSSTKAALFNPTGIVELVAEAKHPIANAGPGRQEQDATDWWRSTCTAVQQLGNLSNVVAVTLSGTMQNVIPLGQDGESLRPAILYGDSRASTEFEFLSPMLASMGASRIIGNQPNEFMAAFKMQWMLKNEPDVFKRTCMIHFGAKDYIIYRLTGTHVTDPTAATAVGLMDLAARCWHPDLLRLFGMPVEKLPDIRPSRSIAGHIKEEAAGELGLPAGTPVINGLGDAGASTIGAGVTETGQAYIYLGTTAWVASVTDLASATIPRQSFVLAHAEAGKVIEVAPLLSGGDCIEWLLGTFGGDLRIVADRMPIVDASPPDLLFLPYLKGERSPFIDTAVRGGFLMLDRTHGLPEMFYAVMEGVSVLLRANVDSLGVTADRIRLLGGGGLSDIWPQLIADATERMIEVADEPGIAPAFGAFCEAAHVLDWSQPRHRFERCVSPRSERSARGERRRRIFLAATAFARTLNGVPDKPVAIDR